MKEHQTVVLLEDNPEGDLQKGDIGAIVFVYENGKAYEVEFVSGDGKPIALLTLTADKLRPISEKEILHVRELVL
jgi:hypothetical protein